MEPHDEIILPDVTPEQFAALQDHFRTEGGAVGAGDAGLAENECFAAKFQYRPGARLLAIEPLRLVPNLTPRRLRKVVEQLMAPPRPPQLTEAGEKIFKPTPHSCATYNWAIGYFTNNSGGMLTYAGSDTTHGNLQTVVDKIKPGEGPSAHEAGFWINKGTKDSVLGCFGSISYQLADGVTTLTVIYGVNTASNITATAALSGQNAARYTATCVWYKSFDFAAEFLYPYVTISKS